MPRYLAVRTDKKRIPFILRELEAGRLRQGWGWKPSHDLRLLRGRLSGGGSLQDEEVAVWRNRRLLDSEPDGVKPGDLLVLPNLPRQGQWLLARVKGAYSFEQPPEHEGVGGDFGHVVPVEVLRRPDKTPGVVEADNEHVPGDLRGSMQAQGRLWSLDRWGAHLENLARQIEAGQPTDTSPTEEQRIQSFASRLRAAAWQALRSQFHGAEMEPLIVRLFQKLYPNASVEHLGGPGERGADLLVVDQDVLGFERRIAVQVKMYEGEHDDTGALEQLRTAQRLRQVQAGVVVSTAQRLSARFERELESLDKELPTRVIHGDELTNLLLVHVVGEMDVACSTDEPR